MFLSVIYSNVMMEVTMVTLADGTAWYKVGDNWFEVNPTEEALSGFKPSGWYGSRPGHREMNYITN